MKKLIRMLVYTFENLYNQSEKHVCWESIVIKIMFCLDCNCHHNPMRKKQPMKPNLKLFDVGDHVRNSVALFSFCIISLFLLSRLLLLWLLWWVLPSFLGRLIESWEDLGSVFQYFWVGAQFYLELSAEKSFSFVSFCFFIKTAKLGFLTWRQDGCCWFFFFYLLRP
jgi:hypothetical protein